MEMEQPNTIMNNKDKIVTTSKMQKKNKKFRIEISIFTKEGNEPIKRVALFDGIDMCLSSSGNMKAKIDRQRR